MKLLLDIVVATLAGILLAIVLTVIFPPVARAQGEGGAVALLGEPCRLTEQIKNLPFRATWTEGGKVYEGCWGRHRQAPDVIVTFWEDLTIVPIMREQLRPAGPKVQT